MITTIKPNPDHRRGSPRAPKTLLTLLAITMIATGANACGSTSPHTTPNTPTTTNTTTPTTTNTIDTTDYTKADADKDNDIGAPSDDKNNIRALEFGHEANQPDRRAITALIKRYYTVALTSNGTKACSMLLSTLAEAVPEDYGQPPGPPYMLGAKTCQTAMTKLFNHIHTQLTNEVPKLKVTHVYLDEHHGIAILNFKTLPERKISIAREANTWKMAALTDDELP